MIAEGVLVDTSQEQLAQQQHQQQMQQQQVQMQQQTAMAQQAIQSGPMQSGPMNTRQISETNGTTTNHGRMNSGDGCCDNARERAKGAVAKVAPCACKLQICIGSLNMYLFSFILSETLLREFK